MIYFTQSSNKLGQLAYVDQSRTIFVDDLENVFGLLLRYLKFDHFHQLQELLLIDVII